MSAGVASAGCSRTRRGGASARVGTHRRIGRQFAAVAALVASLLAPVVAGAEQPLPSWKDGAARDAIVSFVERVTTEGSADFVEPAARIAVFDNDGTLMVEQPMYVQLAFAVDRVRALAPEHPEWGEQEPFRSLLAGDLAAVAAGGTKALLELVVATHAGMSSEEFDRVARAWLAEAKDPRTGRLYRRQIYQPMVELLEWLRARGFKTYIVSGGGIEFIRAFSVEAYGIAPEQVVGSRLAMAYSSDAKAPKIVRREAVEFIDDKAGKPVGIQQHIGRRPIAAFGNSDGDFEMLEWTTSGPGARLGVLLHHDDAQREYAYDRESSVGHLERGLDEAEARGWTVVSMQRDWARVFADAPKP